LQYSKYENKKILSTLSHFKQLLQKISKPHGICDKMFLFQNPFSQDGEKLPPKKSLIILGVYNIVK
jgi:hypothetical protein